MYVTTINDDSYSYLYLCFGSNIINRGGNPLLCCERRLAPSMVYMYITLVMLLSVYNLSIVLLYRKSYPYTKYNKMSKLTLLTHYLHLHVVL